jgi:hypothetical protein
LKVTEHCRAANAGIRWIKAVDAAGKIVGVAQYAVLEDPTKHYANCFEVAPETTWPEPSDKEYAEELWESYIRPRREVLATEKYPVVCESLRATLGIVGKDLR